MPETRNTKRGCLERLPTDIFGSDVFVHYQSTYVWQANQVGHFAIGFVFASLLSWGFVSTGANEVYYYALCVVFILLYASKEYIDLLIAKKQARGFFHLDKRELWYDMAADTWFVASGLGVASAAHAMPWYGLPAAAAAIVAFLRIRKCFLPAKKSLDRAAMPFMFRLCNFPKTKNTKQYNAWRVCAFITGNTVNEYRPSPAVLIQGYRGTGKTTLAVGIGSEVALHKRNGRYGRSLYLTAFNLFDSAGPKASNDPGKLLRWKPRFLGSGDPWRLEEADVLIIDDVDSDLCAGITAKKLIERIRDRPELCRLLKEKKTVWVTGSTEFQSDNKPNGWSAWLEAISEFYGCTIDKKQTEKTPEAIMKREPIPVIWLDQPIE